MSEPWQPIETAPKDRPILGRSGGDYAVVRWSELGSCWNLMVCGAYAADNEWWPSEWCEIPGVGR